MTDRTACAGRRTLATFLRAALAPTALAASVALLTVADGCSKYVNPPPAPAQRYHTIPADPTMPVYMKGSVHDLAETDNTGVFPVSNWGLVAGLRSTGDSTCPTLVREWMLKEMSVHKFGSTQAGYQGLTPEAALNDPHFAIVGVMAYIPPGARKGDYCDVAVQVMPGNNTTSLANGMLYRSDLKINGLADPVGAVNAYAVAQGNVFVNPAYAALGAPAVTAAPASMESLRVGVVPHGGIVKIDRPLHLVMRTPSWSTSRAIENRVKQRFQDLTIAAAQDEGRVYLYLPASYHGDWEHFLGVVTHLYMNGDTGFSALKAKQLAEEAQKPEAKLMDISYAWEALGVGAIPAITPLLSSPQQDVQFAAARAAAFLGDGYGQQRLLQIALTRGHPFQINAVQTLGALNNAEDVDSSLAKLLDSDQSLVRIEAYKVLVGHNSPYVYSRPIHSNLNPENEFVMDVVRSNGPPLIYCTRLGVPRVAIFGQRVSMKTPVTFTAFDKKLMIANLPDKPQVLNLFYRDEGRHNGPVQALSTPDIAEMIVRLGGGTDEGFHFTYGDVVAILQAMADTRSIGASFVLQQLPDIAKQVEQAPSLDQGRPQADGPTTAPSGAGVASLPDLPMLPQKAAKGDNKQSGPTSGRPQ